MHKNKNIMSEKRKVFETEHDKNLLLHAVINQLETDFDDQDYDAMDEFLTQLMKVEENHNILYQYLTDSAQENWLEGKTNCRF